MNFFKSLFSYLLLMIMYSSAETRSFTYATDDQVFTVIASSELPSKTPGTYAVKNLFDGNNQTAWVEGQKGSGINEWIEMSIAAPDFFEGIIISPGYMKNTMTFCNNCIPLKIELSIDGTILGTYLLNYRVSFSEDPGRSSGCYPVADTVNLTPKIIVFKEPVQGKKLKVTFIDVYQGVKYSDMAVSELYPIRKGKVPANYQPVTERLFSFRNTSDKISENKTTDVEDLNAKVVVWDSDKGWVVTDTSHLKMYPQDIKIYKRTEKNQYTSIQQFFLIFNKQIQSHAISVVKKMNEMILLGGVDYEMGDGEWIELYPVIKINGSMTTFYELHHIDGAPGCHDVVPNGELFK